MFEHSKLIIGAAAEQSEDSDIVPSVQEEFDFLSVISKVTELQLSEDEIIEDLKYSIGQTLNSENN